MRTDRVVLLTGDYANRLDHLEAALRLAAADEPAEDTSRRAGESDPIAALVAEYEETKAEAEAAGIVVELQSIGRREWREIREKHPPRSGDDVDPEDARADRRVGVNLDAAEEDVIYHSLVSVTEDGETKRYRDDQGRLVVTEAVFQDWVDTLTPGDFSILLNRAWDLMNGSRSPKSLPSSLTRRSAPN